MKIEPGPKKGDRGSSFVTLVGSWLEGFFSMSFMTDFASIFLPPGGPLGGHFHGFPKKKTTILSFGASLEKVAPGASPGCYFGVPF
jgi:hypothetical protein